jgi:hypothetical protein
VAQATVREKYSAVVPALTAQPAVTETEDRVEIAMTEAALPQTEGETAQSALKENTKTTIAAMRPAPEETTEKEPRAAKMTAGVVTSVR